MMGMHSYRNWRWVVGLQSYVRREERTLAWAGIPIIFLGMLAIRAVVSQSGLREPAEPDTTSLRQARPTPLLRVIDAPGGGVEASAVTKHIAILKAALARAGTSDPWASKALADIGDNYRELGQYEQALPFVDEALRLPEPIIGVHFSAMHTKALCLQELGRNVEAIAALREARTMSAPGCIRDSELSHEYYAVGMAQIVGGQHVAAAETFAELSRWAEVQDKGDWQAILPDALVEEADQLIRAGKTREGAAVYDEFLHRYPRRPDSVTIAYARVCAIHDGPEHLKPADLLAICSAYPTDTGAAQGVVYQLGESYIMVDQYQEALTVLRRVYNFRPKPGDKLDQPDMPATAGSQMVVCYCALGQIKEAEAAVADLEHRFPSNHDEVTTAGDFVESYKAQRRER